MRESQAPPTSALRAQPPHSTPSGRPDFHSQEQLPQGVLSPPSFKWLFAVHHKTHFCTCHLKLAGRGLQGVLPPGTSIPLLIFPVSLFRAKSLTYSLSGTKGVGSYKLQTAGVWPGRCPTLKIPTPTQLWIPLSRRPYRVCLWVSDDTHRPPAKPGGRELSSLIFPQRAP